MSPSTTMTVRMCLYISQTSSTMHSLLLIRKMRDRGASFTIICEPIHLRVISMLMDSDFILAMESFLLHCQTNVQMDLKLRSFIHSRPMESLLFQLDCWKTKLQQHGGSSPTQMTSDSLVTQNRIVVIISLTLKIEFCSQLRCKKLEWVCGIRKEKNRWNRQMWKLWRRTISRWSIRLVSMWELLFYFKVILLTWQFNRWTVTPTFGSSLTDCLEFFSALWIAACSISTFSNSIQTSSSEIQDLQQGSIHRTILEFVENFPMRNSNMLAVESMGRHRTP